MTTARTTYHAGLSREYVLHAAVDLLQQTGLGGFSVRRLAAALGVDPMSIYGHVRNKDDLLAGAVAVAFQAARPTGEGEWWEQIAAALREHRRVVRAHPWVLDVMLHRPVQLTDAWSGVEASLALLHEHLIPSESARWLRLLVAFTNGFLFSERDVERPEFADDMRALAQSQPLVAGAVRRGAGTADSDFEAGLTTLIRAMREDAARP